jgi:hypothetical protein
MATKVGTASIAALLDNRVAAGAPCVERIVKEVAVSRGSASCVTVYRTFCTALRMKPNGAVLLALRQVEVDGPKSVMSLNLSAAYLGRRGVAPLVDVFLQLVNLASLSLAGTGLDDWACGLLCRSLALHPSLRVLDLSRNHITPSAMPALRLLCAQTGCHVKLDGNPDMFPASIRALAAVSLQAKQPPTSTSVGEPSRDASPIRSRQGEVGSFAFQAHLMRRRLEQHQMYAQQRPLRRVSASSDGWVSLSVFASTPFRGFHGEVALLRDGVIPRLNRRLRALKIHLTLCAVHAPARVEMHVLAGAPPSDARADAFKDDAVVAANREVRSALVNHNTDIFCCFSPGGMARGACPATAMDWRAKERLGDGAVPTLVFERTAVRGLPEALRDDLEPASLSHLVSYQQAARRELAAKIRAVSPCCRVEYDADYDGLTEQGTPVLSLPAILEHTLAADLYTAALTLADQRQRPAKINWVVGAEPDELPLEATVVPSIVAAVERIAGLSTDAPKDTSADGVPRPVIVVQGPPGCGKTANLTAARAALRARNETRVCAQHAVLSRDRSLHSVLHALLEQLGMRDTLLGWYPRATDLIDDFIHELNCFAAPPGARVVTLLVDDGDRVTEPAPLSAFANVDQSRLCTSNGVPVCIVYTVDLNPHDRLDTSAGGTRLFLQRIRVPGLSEEQAVNVLVRLLRARGVVRGPQSEAEARRAGVHLVMQKAHGCRPLYMALAALAIRHWNEETAMIAIADVLPDTLDELVAHVLHPEHLPTRVAAVLAATVATTADGGDGVPTELLELAVGFTRDPHDPRGGPAAEHHRKRLGWWAYLVDARPPPLAALDTAAARALLSDVFQHTGDVACRGSLYFGSATIETVMRAMIDPSSILFDECGVSDTDSVAAMPPHTAHGLRYSKTWSAWALRLRDVLSALARRHAFVAHHRHHSVGLANLDAVAFTNALSPQLIFAFLQCRRERELQRRWRAVAGAALLRNQREGSLFRAYDAVLARHWAAIVDMPTNVFHMVADMSGRGDGRRLPASERDASERHDAFEVSVQAAFASTGTPCGRLAVRSVVSIVGGWDPSTGPVRPPSSGASAPSSFHSATAAAASAPTGLAALPLRAVPSAVATFVYLGPDSRGVTVKGQVDAAKACARHCRFDAFLRVGELGAVAPPTFSECDETRASLRTHDGAIAAVVVVESEDLTRCRVAVSGLQQRRIVLVACYVSDGRLQLQRVALIEHDDLPATPLVMALSAAPPAGANDVADLGVWAPSVAVASGSTVLVWPSDPRGADTLVNRRQDAPQEPTALTGLASAVSHVAFSPGGAKICAIDSTGLVLVWGSLESPCPALTLATSIIGDVVKKILFPLPDEVFFVTQNGVKGWNCVSSHVRNVIVKPTSVPYEDMFAVTHVAKKTQITDSAGVDLPRPLLRFTFVDTNTQVVTTFAESLHEAGTFAEEPEGAIRIASADAPLQGGEYTVVPSPTGPLIVDLALNHVRRCSAADGPSLSPFFVAAAPTDDPASSEKPTMPPRRRPAQASITCVATATHGATGQEYVVLGARRRMPDAVNGALMSEVAILVCAVVDTGAPRPPVHDTLAFDA